MERPVFDLILPVALGGTYQLRPRARFELRHALFESGLGVVVCSRCKDEKTRREVAAYDAWKWLRSGHRIFIPPFATGGVIAPPPPTVVRYGSCPMPVPARRWREPERHFLRRHLPHAAMATYFDAEGRQPVWHIHYDPGSCSLTIDSRQRLDAGCYLGEARLIDPERASESPTETS